MERVGHRWQTLPGRAHDYDRMHAKVWEPLEQLFRDSGVHEYVIYRSGDDVFSHMAVDDYERLVAAFADDETAQRWETKFTDIIRYPQADPVTGWPERLREVWRLGLGPTGGVA
jgi:L-rhamnose mutarotase